jgi:hypothetical protein
MTAIGHWRIIRPVIIATEKGQHRGKGNWGLIFWEFPELTHGG